MKRFVVFFIVLLPFIVYLTLALINRLGVNPVDELIEVMGFTAMILLFVVTLLPLFRFVGLNLLPYRRMLGLYVFFYASVHLLLVFSYELAFKLSSLFVELVDKPFMWLGLLAWLVLLPLALTSTRFSQRKLKKNWKKLHQVVYLALLLVAVHYGLQLRGELLNYFILVFAVLCVFFVKFKVLKFVKRFV